MLVTEVQAANISVAKEVPPLELISMDESLINHSMLLVQRNLPGLVASAYDPMNQVALSMGAFTIEAREARRISQDNETSNKNTKGPT